MRRVILFGALAVAMIVSAPSRIRAQSQEERAVRALLDRFIQSANSTDEKLALQNLTEHSRNGGPFFPPFGMSLASFPEVEAAVKQGQGQVIARSYTATSPITIRTEKNLGWAAYTWRANFTFKDGTQHNYQGRATATFVREGKTWKFAHWHSSIVAPAPLTAAARDLEAEKIIAVERSAWEALKAKQLDQLADYYADDASMFDDSLAYRVRGKEALLRGLRSWQENTELRSYQMLDPQVQLLGDTALLTYYFSLSAMRAGKEMSQTGKITLLFVRQGGSWKALHEHLSVNR